MGVESQAEIRGFQEHCSGSAAWFTEGLGFVGIASIEPTELCLAEEVFNLFLAMFLYCISGKADEELDAVKEIVSEALPAP